MKQEAGIKWLFLDLNSYFASVEQQEQPHLRRKPVAVTPMNTPDTCAIAASYEAKIYGVHTGMIIRDAMRICPHLQCTVARHDIYVDYHHRILNAVINHTPIDKIWSIDELSSRLPPNKRHANAARHIAHSIKDEIRDTVGAFIKCSIGFAPNSFLAKIACEMHKPDGLTILSQEDLPGPLLDLSLTDIPGIGKNIKRRLNKAGVYTVENLWTLSPKHMRKIWGAVQGERFWYMLHGYDIESPLSNTSMVGHSRVLDPALRAPYNAKKITKKLAFRAAQRLQQKGFFAQNIQLSVRTVTGFCWSQDMATEPTSTAFVFLQYLDVLWGSMMNDVENAHTIDNGALKLKSVSVIYNNLITPAHSTYDIFLHDDAEKKMQNSKFESLQHAITNLQERYKKDVVSLGITPKTSSGYVGTKISFSRVPDKNEFWR